MHVKRPTLYIEFIKDKENHRLGPFYDISFSGTGLVTNQDWVAYQVQTADFRFVHVIVPYYHSIVSSEL